MKLKAKQTLGMNERDGGGFRKPRAKIAAAVVLKQGGRR